MEINLDGLFITNKKTLFIKLQEQLGDKGLVGSNLDALWDVLYDISDEINIRIINKAQLVNNLGDYGKDLLKLFEELTNNNVSITYQ